MFVLDRQESKARASGNDIQCHAPVGPPLGDGGLKSTFTYKEQLEKGLKARRPSDFTFIAAVVTKIENGDLTQRMVNETFDYARSRSRDYPFTYFQFALRKRAEKLGVAL